MDGADAQHKIEEAEARVNAMRDQATIRGGRSAGATRPQQQDPKAHIDAQAAARQASAAAAAAFAGQFANLTEGAMGDGAFDAEEDVEHEVAEDKEEEVQRVRKPGAGHAKGPEFGGEADPAPADATTSDSSEDPVKRGPAKWPRVSAKRRIRDLDLERILALGKAEGLLVGWQAETVRPRVLGLTSQWYACLAQAFEAVEQPLGRVVLLKALAAHRHPLDVATLVPVLGEHDTESLRSWHASLEDERPVSERNEAGPPPSIDVLRRHYDPIATLGEEPDGLPCPEELEEWRVPKWLRGVRPEPLELCAVAFHQAACDHLHPEWETSDGAGDPLMAALETHHPAGQGLARWCTTLGARSADHDGLWAAIDALLRARAGL